MKRIHAAEAADRSLYHLAVQLYEQRLPLVPPEVLALGRRPEAAAHNESVMPPCWPADDTDSELERELLS